MCGAWQISSYSVPVPVVALLLVVDDSVLPDCHLDLAIGHVQSQQGDGSSPCYMEDQPFGRLGLDVKREVRPDAQEKCNSEFCFYCSYAGRN